MSSEIQLYDKMPDPIMAIERLGTLMAKSGLSGAEKTETGMMLAWACIAERKSPFDIFRTYHLVEGKLAMRADAMLAKFRQLGGKVKWKRFDAEAAIGVWTFEGVDTEIGFTMEDAKKMEVIRPRSGWTKAPDAMLRARCIAKAVRMICPEVIAGYLSVEEITDDPGDAPQKEIVLPQSSVTVAPAESSAAPKRGRPPKSAEQAPIDVVSQKIDESIKAQEQVVQKLGEVIQKAENESKLEPAKPIDPPKSVSVPATDAIGANPEAGPFMAKVGKDSGIDTATVAHLMGLFQTHDCEAAAFEWLKKKPHWFVAQKSDNIGALLPEKAQTIIDKFPAFVKQINIK